jgi:glycosyltransferase involved in cell wall biosynthesis
MISILLAAYKSNELLKRVFLPSFIDNADGISELIIYDNGGNEQLSKNQDDKFSYGRVCTIGNGQNIGLNAALNECVKHMKGDYFFLPHTDMWILPNCLRSLQTEAKKHPSHTYLFCSRSIEPAQGHTRHHIIKNFGKEANDFQEEQLGEYFKSYKDRGIEIGARMPFFGHRKLLDKMTEFNIKNNICDGPFDDKYFSYCTDDDLIHTAWHMGVRKFWLLQESVVYHLQGKSNNQQNVDKDSNKPYEYFIDKWQKVGYKEARHPGQWHLDLLPFYSRIR